MSRRCHDIKLIQSPPGSNPVQLDRVEDAAVASFSLEANTVGASRRDADPVP